MKQIHKTYDRPFLLEKAKLDRLMEIVHDRLDEHRATTKDDKFEVFLSGQRHEQMTGVDDVLKLDNSRRSRIERLLITSSASIQRVSRSEHEIQVDFDGKMVGKSKSRITVSVQSDDAGWCDRALSEIEGLVERTWLEDALHRAALVVGAILVTLFLALLVLSSLGSSGIPFRDADVMWLRHRDVGRVEQILKQNRTISDEEMREIATRQLRNVLDGLRDNKPSNWTWQEAFVGGPLLIVLICMLYLMTKCYPSAVFFWRDEVSRYNTMLQTRKIVWGVIGTGIVLPVLSGLLFMGLVSKR